VRSTSLGVLHRAQRIHESVKDKALRMQLDRLDIFEMSFKTGAERLYLTAIAAAALKVISAMVASSRV
jgi:hypothetical protein